MNVSTRACTAGSGRGRAVPRNSGNGRSCGRGIGHRRRVEAGLGRGVPREGERRKWHGVPGLAKESHGTGGSLPRSQRAPRTTPATVGLVPTDKPLADVWADRDFPVLVEITRLVDEGASTVAIAEVAGALDWPDERVQHAAKALERRGLLETMGVMSGQVLRVRNLRGEAYLLTGLHPDGDDALGKLISALRQAAEQTNDPDEKGRLRKAASALGDIAGQVGAGVMTAYLTGMLPGH